MVREEFNLKLRNIDGKKTKKQTSSHWLHSNACLLYSCLQMKILVYSLLKEKDCLNYL